MLVRVLPVVAKDDLPTRLKHLLSETDVVLEFASGGESFWDRVTQAPADLIVVEQLLLPEPATETIQALRELPDKPEVVAIWDKEDSGYCEMAHGGTIFLDEFGEVPGHVQVKLLRVLEGKSALLTAAVKGAVPTRSTSLLAHSRIARRRASH